MSGDRWRAVSLRRFARVGLFGALIAGISIVVKNQHKTTPGINGPALALAGFLRIRAEERRSRLLALAVATFAILAVTT